MDACAAARPARKDATTPRSSPARRTLDYKGEELNACNDLRAPYVRVDVGDVQKCWQALESLRSSSSG